MAQYGQRGGSHDLDSVPVPSLQFLLADNLLQVTTPIHGRNDVLGYDVIWFDFANIINQINSEIIEFSLIGYNGGTNSNENKPSMPRVIDLDPNDTTVVFSPISETHWSLRAQISNSDLYAPYYGIIKQLVWVLGGFILIALTSTQTLIINTAKRLIAELQMAYEKYKTLACRDPLSKVYTRHYFNEWLSQHESNHLDQELSLIMLDVNGLKQINDSFGHLAGDDVIKEVGKVLLDNFRKDDVVFRYGGDEFAIVAQASKEQCENAVERALMMLKNAGPNGIPITFSYGVIKFDTADAANLLDKADTMMYEMKGTRGNLIKEQ